MNSVHLICSSYHTLVNVDLVLVLDGEELVVDTTSAFLHRAWAVRVALEHSVPTVPQWVPFWGPF